VVRSSSEPTGAGDGRRASVPTAGAPATASAWSGERARVLGREAQPGRGNGLLGRPMRQGFGPFFLFVLQEMFQMKLNF